MKLVLPEDISLRQPTSPDSASPPSSQSNSKEAIAMPKDKDTHSRSSAHKPVDKDRDLADIGVEPISADDYFLKSDNFRLWLRKEKGKVCGCSNHIQQLLCRGSAD